MAAARKRKFVYKSLHDKFGHSKKKRGMNTTPKESEFPKSKPLVIKRSFSKSEIIHSNGKTRPIRGEKGQFVGCETINDEHTEIDLSTTTRAQMANINKPLEQNNVIEKDEPKRNWMKGLPLSHSDIVFRSVKNPITGKTHTVGTAGGSQDSAQHRTVEYLNLYRIHSDLGGKQFVFSKLPPFGKNVECMMTLYDPKADMVVLDRAMRKYYKDDE